MLIAELVYINTYIHTYMHSKEIRTYDTFDTRNFCNVFPDLYLARHMVYDINTWQSNAVHKD